MASARSSSGAPSRPDPWQPPASARVRSHRECTGAWAWLLAATMATAVSPPAHAQTRGVAVEPSPDDIERARELYDNGVGLYEEGSYEGAALAFQRAYELSEDSNLLYNIALAYDRLGEFDEAIEYLDRYRAFAPQSERAELERRKKSLVTRRDRQRQAQLEGKDLELTPEDDDDDEALDDAVIPAPAAPTPAGPTKPDRLMTPAAWALTATTAVGLGLGTGFGAASLSRSRSGRDGCTEAADALYCQSTAGPDLARGRTFALVADVSFAVAAAAAVGAVVVVALAARRRTRGQTAALPYGWPHGGGVALRHRF